MQELQTSALTSLIQESNRDKIQSFNILKDVNMIVSFSYTDNDLAGWVNTIYRLFPRISARVIGQITDNFLKGRHEFRKDEGIVNYTRLIESYIGTE